MGLTEKLIALGVQGLMGQNIENKRRAQTSSLVLFLEDAWMIVQQLPAFPKEWYFVQEEKLQEQARGFQRVGLAGGGGLFSWCSRGDRL